MQKSRKIALGVFILLACVAALATGIYFATKPKEATPATTAQLPTDSSHPASDSSPNQEEAKNPDNNDSGSTNDGEQTPDMRSSESNAQPSTPETTMPAESKPIETQPGIKTFNWVITEQKMTLDGVERVGIAVNGKPGHLSPIVVTQGDRVILNVQNNLGASTTIHFHGLLQRGYVFLSNLEPPIWTELAELRSAISCPGRALHTTFLLAIK